MKTIKLNYPNLIEKSPETIAAIGFFDGIHKGHQQVINQAVQKAIKQELKSAVITFHPHPSVILNKSIKHIKYITPLEQKQKLLKNLGVDLLYILQFDQELSQLSPQAFIDHFITGLNIQHLIAGFDFSFGFKGEGNMQNINNYTKGRFTYSVVEKVSIECSKISST